MKIDFRKPFTGLDGKPVEPVEMLNSLLGTYIGRSAKVDGASDQKANDWAVMVFNDGYLDLDNADLDVLSKFIEAIPNTSLMVRDQLARCIRLSKDQPIIKQSDKIVEEPKQLITLPAASH